MVSCSREYKWEISLYELKIYCQFDKINILNSRSDALLPIDQYFQFLHSYNSVS